MPFLLPKRMVLALSASLCLIGATHPLAAQEAAAVTAPRTEIANPAEVEGAETGAQGAAAERAPQSGVETGQNAAVTATEAPPVPEATPEGAPDQAPAAQAPAAPETAPAAATPAAPVPPTAPAEAGIAHGLNGHDLSPMGMYRQADAIVKGVMLVLLAAAIVAWIILIAKVLQLASARARARKVLHIVSDARDLPAAQQSLQGQRGVAATLVRAAGDEIAVSQDIIALGVHEGVKERVSSRLGRIEAAAARKIGQGVGILASIGSVGPFVGLFGTVWGIMNAFIGIAETQTTNLAVVAPGIAEALLATAFGLVAAIPAVVIYNGLARATTGYRAILADLSAAIERLVSRDLDRAAAKGAR